MTPANISLSVISITGGLLLGVVLLAFVLASWINQPPSKQHLRQSSSEETLALEAYPVSSGPLEARNIHEGVGH